MVGWLVGWLRGWIDDGSRIVDSGLWMHDARKLPHARRLEGSADSEAFVVSLSLDLITQRRLF